MRSAINTELQRMRGCGLPPLENKADAAAADGHTLIRLEPCVMAKVNRQF